MNDGARTSVKSSNGKSEDFTAKIAVRYKSTLYPLLFSIVSDELTKGIQYETPWCMMFADDVVLINKNMNALKGKLKRWKEFWKKTKWK